MRDNVEGVSSKDKALRRVEESVPFDTVLIEKDEEINIANVPTNIKIASIYRLIVL